MASEILIAGQSKDIKRQLLDVLSEIGKRFTLRSNENEVLSYICEKARELIVPPFHLYVVLQNRWTRELEVKLFYKDNSQKTVEDQEQLLQSIGKRKVGKIILDKKALFLEDAQAIQKYAEASEEPSVCWLGVPMSIADRAIGALVLCHPTEEHAYSSELKEALDAITDLAASEIDHARLMRRLDILAEIKKNLSSLVNPTEERIFEIVIDQAREIVDLYNLSIILQNPETKALNLAFAYRRKKRVDIHDLKGVDEIIGMMPMPVLPRIIETNDSIMLNTEQQIIEAFGGPHSEKIPKSWLGVPMRLGDKTIGVFMIYHTNFENVYDDDDTQILDELSDQAAIAIGHARVFERENQQRRQAQILEKVAREVNATLELKTVCQSVLKELREVVPYSTASIQRIYGNKRTLISDYGRQDIPYDPKLLRDISEDPLFSEIVQTRAGILISDTAHTSKEWEIRDSTRHVKSWMGIPLIAQDSVIGVLTIDHGTPGFYTQEHQHAASMFANHAATALINAELYEQKQHYLSILEDVYPSLPTIGQEGFPIVLQRILENGVALTNAEYADLWLYNSDTQELYLEVEFENKRSKKMYQHGQLQFSIYRENDDVPEGIVSYVVKTGQSYICQDVTTDPHYWEVEANVQAELVIPLRHQETIIGVLNFESTKARAFTPEHQRILEALAGPAAIAIQNARLYKKQEDWSTRRKILVDIGKHLSSNVHTQQPEILELIYEQASRLPGMRENFSIALYDEGMDTVSFELAVVDGTRIQNIQNAEGWKPRRSKKGKTEEIIHTKKPLLLPTQTAVKERGFKPSPNKDYVGEQANFASSWIGVPMKIADRVLGVLATYYYGRDYFYQDEDIEILQLLADHAAIALDRARLSERFKALVKVGQELTSQINLKEKEVLELIYTEALQSLHMKNFSIALYDEQSKTVRFVLVSKGGQLLVNPEQEPRWQSRQHGEGKTERIIQTKQALVLNSHEDIIETEHDRIVRYKGWEKEVSDAWLGVPMMVEGKVLGVLADYRYGQEVKYTSEEVEVFQALANLAAVAIQNARLYKRINDIIEFLPDATFVIDQQGKVIAWNKAIEDMTGVTSDEMIGKGDYEYAVPFYGKKRPILIDLVQDSRDSIKRQNYEKVVKQGDTVFAESHIPRLGGEYGLDFWATASILYDSNGNKIGAIESVRDITQRKRLEKRQAALYEISEAAHNVKNLEELYPVIYNVVSRLIKVKNFYIALYDPETDTVGFPFHIDEYDKLPPVLAPEKYKKGVTGYVLRTEQPLLATPEVFSRLVEQGEIELVGKPTIDWLGVPLKTHGETIGVLAIQSYAEDIRYGQIEQDILMFVSEQVASAIEGVRTEEELQNRVDEQTKELQQSQKVQEALYNISEAAHNVKKLEELYPMIHEIVGELMYAKNFYIALHNPQKEILSFPYDVDKYDPPSKSKKPEKGLTEYVLLGKKQAFLASFETQNKLIERGAIELVGTRSVSWLGVPFELQDKTVGLVAVQSYTEGITYEESDQEVLEFVSTQIASAINRVRSIEREEDLIQRQNALIKLGQQLALKIQRSEQGILELIRQHASLLMDVDNMYVALYDERTETIRFPFRYENGEVKPTEPRKINKNERGRTEEILLTGDSILIQTKDESKKWYQQPGRKEFVGNPYASWIGVPMRLGGKILGVIATYHLAQDYVYEPDDIEILQTMANLAAIAIMNTRLYSYTQQKQAILIKLAQQLTSKIQQSEQDILELIRQHASQLMDADNMYVALYNERTEIIRFAFRYENGEAKPTEPRKINKEERGRTEEILLTGDSILIQTDDESKKWYQQPGHKEFVGTISSSWIGVPVRLGEKILGVIATYHMTQDYVYTRDDLEVLQTMANLAAIALENVRLYRRVSSVQEQVAASERFTIMSKTAAEFAHRMTNLAGTIPIRVDMVKDVLMELDLPPEEEVFEELDGLKKDTLQLQNAANEIRAETRTTTPTLVNVRELLDASLETALRFHPGINKRISIQKDFGIEELPPIYVEETNLRETFVNIISNAIEAIPEEGTVNLSLRKGKIEEKSCLDVIVTDDGVGIPLKSLSQIFDLFYTTKREATERGLGIGLWRDKAFINGIGGTIEVESQEGEGSTFTVKIPMERSSGL